MKPFSIEILNYFSKNPDKILLFPSENVDQPKLRQEHLDIIKNSLHINSENISFGNSFEKDLSVADNDKKKEEIMTIFEKLCKVLINEVHLVQKPYHEFKSEVKNLINDEKIDLLTLLSRVLNIYTKSQILHDKYNEFQTNYSNFLKIKSVAENINDLTPILIKNLKDLLSDFIECLHIDVNPKYEIERNWLTFVKVNYLSMTTITSLIKKYSKQYNKLETIEFNVNEILYIDIDGNDEAFRGKNLVLNCKILKIDGKKVIDLSGKNGELPSNLTLPNNSGVPGKAGRNSGSLKLNYEIGDYNNLHFIIDGGDGGDGGNGKDALIDNIPENNNYILTTNEKFESKWYSFYKYYLTEYEANTIRILSLPGKGGIGGTGGYKGYVEIKKKMN